ncbi:MAG: 2OG-Fe(II) oxygenase [Pseudomonadota bacterium]
MRTVTVKLLLEGGHTQTLELPSEAPELAQLFQALAQRGGGHDDAYERLIQLPLNQGTESFSLNSAQVVAISTIPPVLIQAQGVNDVPDPAVTSSQLHRPSMMIIDDFLAPHEYADMLAFAIQHREAFGAGTVVTGPQNARKNLAFLDFAEHPHSKLVTNRLLTWLPVLLQRLSLAAFPVHQVESQLTASNDGHFYRAHVDRDSNTQLERVLTCVYYFGKTPAQFSGGALRIYDAILSQNPVDRPSEQAGSFQQIEPLANRMVVFPSDCFHELLPVRCPSRRFEDSRFAITNWIWGSADADRERRHGWGHLKCGSVSPHWSNIGGSR